MALAPTDIKVAGHWKSVDQVMIKIGGHWKPVDQIMEKVAGHWKHIGTTAHPPLFTGAIGNIRAIIGQPFSLDVSSRWATGPVPTGYSLNAAPAGMVISNSGVISWPAGTATLVAGVSVTATNSGGDSTSNTFEARIDAGLDFGGTIEDLMAIEGVPYSEDASHHWISAAGPITSFSLLHAPAGMTISSAGVINWTAQSAGTTASGVIAVAHNSIGEQQSNVFGAKAHGLGPELVESPMVCGTGKDGVSVKCTTGVTITGGVVHIQEVGITRGVGISTLTPGLTYIAAANIVEIKSGDFVVKISGIKSNIVPVGFTGRLEFIHTAVSRPSAEAKTVHSGDVTIDSFSVREVLP